jgi:hypothetical protein
MTLDVWIQEYKTKAIINSGYTGNMILSKFMKKVGIPRYDRAQKVYLYTFNGNSIKENGGTIKEETGKVGLKIRRHKKRVKFDIIITQGYDVILRLPWLITHNLTIDYTDRSIRFDNCIHDGKRNPKIELEEISFKVIFMHYHRDPDSVILAMVDLDKKE